MLTTETPYYKLFLKEELARRCDSNANYSMRSFARALSVDPAVLSRTLSDKRALSFKVASRMITNLCLSPKEREIFLESVAEDQKQRGLKNSVITPTEKLEKIQVNMLDAELFRVISDWYHYAIQQFTLVEGFRSETKWIARKLGITVLESKLAIQRLITIGLLKSENGKLIATDAKVDTKDKSISTPALRMHQKQMLRKAMYSLENDPFPTRSMTSMTLPIDHDKLPLARKMIEEFTNNLRDVMTSGKRKKVYQLSISFFPLEKLDNEPQ